MGKNETAAHVCEQYRGTLLTSGGCPYCLDLISKQPIYQKPEPPKSMKSIGAPGASLSPAMLDSVAPVTITDGGKPKKENILEEANRITSGDRRKSYGKASKQLMTLVQLWAPILGKEPTALQVALCLLQLKVSRELHQHSRDNVVDIAGYARVIEMLFDGE